MVESKPGQGAKKKPRAKKAKKQARKSSGRPEFKPTAEQRERVEILIGGGMAIDEIAAALNLAKNTLKKHFGVELRMGRSKKRAEVLEAMYNSAKGGNVSAQKSYITLNALAEADEALRNPAADRKDSSIKAPRVPALGKKEQADLVAETAGVGTEWAKDLDPTVPVGAKAN
jgi:DNA-binding CsgD family transcriptional regulator